MSAKADARKRLESAIRLAATVPEGGQRRCVLSAAMIAVIAGHAEAHAEAAVAEYKRAAARRRKAAQAPAAPREPAVHWTLPGGTRGVTACRPGDWASSRWNATADPGQATCKSCQATPAWKEATAPPRLTLAASPEEAGR